MRDFNLKREIKFFSFSFVSLLIIWIILSGYFEVFFILCGIFSSIFTLLILRRLINAEAALYQILDNANVLVLFRLVSYIPWLSYQIVLSSIYVAKRILHSKHKLEPIIILKKCKGHNDKSITLFANSVTITPGTLTLHIEKKQQIYLSTICLLDKALESGVSDIENKTLKTLRSTK